MITTGADFMGPELTVSLIKRAIMRIGQGVATARGDWKEGSTPAVNVVFYVPGSLGTFDIPSIEASRFSRKRKLLLVAVPVPASIVNSDKATEFVIDALYKANAIAAGVFSQKGNEPFDLKKADSIVDKVKDVLGNEFT